MNNSLNKRKNRNPNMMNSSNISNHGGGHNMINLRSKPPRGKTSPQEKNASQAEGVYYNGRMMHAATSLVGSIVQVVVKGGNTYEGVMKTFSPDFEIVVDMVVEIDPKACSGGQNICGLLDSLRSKREVHNTMIFKLNDVTMLNLLNVDLDFASRGHFTDTEISRFDGQGIGKGKDLVPWDGPPEKDGLTLEEDGKNAQNGWDANDMFKMNEEKYQVSSTYDSTLQGYTVPLELKDTEEFKQKQAEAERIAQDIENDAVYKERIAKEDGDEEEKYSAVTRPSNDSHSGPHLMRQTGRRKSQNSSSNSVTGGGVRGKALQNSAPLLPSPTSYQKIPYHHHPQQHNPSYSNKSPSTASPPAMQQKSVSKDEAGMKPSNIAGGGGHGYNRNDPDDYGTQPITQAPAAPLPQRSHTDNRRSNISKKREDVSADFKKFSSDFKLAPEVKEVSLKDNSPKDVSVKAEHVVPSDKSDVSKDKESKVASNVEIEKHVSSAPDVDAESDAEKVVKKSTLNPNAKEFNPSVKSFTPRAPAFTVPQNPSTIASGVMITTQQQQQAHQAHQTRLQAPMVQFQPQFVAPVQFTMAPNQYIMQNMAVAPAFQTNNNAQNIRYRSKGPQQYQNQNNRHDYSQPSAQVAAATGHPVLATAPIAQQIAVPYNPAQQAPNSGPPQVYSTALYPMHTRMNMGAVGVVPHVSYGDPNLQPYFMTNVGHVQLQSHLVAQAVAAQQNATGGGQHSAPTTPQSGPPSTPLHGAPPTPSPVHHQGSGVPNQPPTPTPGLMYGGIPPHGGQTAVSVSSHSTNCTPHYVNPQMVPLILPTGQAMQHTQHPATGHAGHVHPSLSHANAAANHHGVNSSQTPLLSAVPVTIPVIPTSATIVATPGAIQTHFAPNSQNRI